MFEKLCFFQFQFVIDCNELRLSVTITTLTIFNEQTRYKSWRMAKSSVVMEEENLFLVIEYFSFFRYVYAAASSSRVFSSICIDFNTPVIRIV